MCVCIEENMLKGDYVLYPLWNTHLNIHDHCIDKFSLALIFTSMEPTKMYVK